MKSQSPMMAGIGPGAAVGSAVGESVGVVVGSSVGVAVGDSVSAVGSSVGESSGTAEGDSVSVVGDSVGNTVGDCASSAGDAASSSSAASAGAARCRVIMAGRMTGDTGGACVIDRGAVTQAGQPCLYRWRRGDQLGEIAGALKFKWRTGRQRRSPQKRGPTRLPEPHTRPTRPGRRPWTTHGAPAQGQRASTRPAFQRVRSSVAGLGGGVVYAVLLVRADLEDLRPAVAAGRRAVDKLCAKLRLL